MFILGREHFSEQPTPCLLPPSSKFYPDKAGQDPT